MNDTPATYTWAEGVAEVKVDTKKTLGVVQRNRVQKRRRGALPRTNNKVPANFRPAYGQIGKNECANVTTIHTPTSYP